MVSSCQNREVDGGREDVVRKEVLVDKAVEGEDSEKAGQAPEENFVAN